MSDDRLAAPPPASIVVIVITVVTVVTVVSGFVAGVLGCWRAGAAFLPIDARWPADRLAFVVRDSGLSLAVSAGETAAELGRLGVRVAGDRASRERERPEGFLPPVAHAPGSPASPMHHPQIVVHERDGRSAQLLRHVE